jgi:pilus assembly protein CpaE
MNAPWIMNRRTGNATPRDPFAAFVSDDTTANTFRTVMGEYGWPAERLYKGGVRNAIQTLAVSASPQILVIDLSESPDTVADINGLAEVCEPGTIVLAVGSINDVLFYRDLLNSGIQDYLLKPVQPEVLREAIAQAQAALHAPKVAAADPERPKTLCAVLGVRGGVGASAMASSLAWVSSKAHQRKTALLDLDIQFGTGALAFDLEPGRGLTDALENPSRIDSLFIERALVRESETLAILSAEAPINSPLMADPNAFHHLQEELRNAFDVVVVDMPRHLAVQTPHLLHEANTIVLVTEMTLCATRDTIRMLPFLKAAAPSATVLVVANRVPSSGQPEVSRKDFETSIERPVDFLIPLDPKAAATGARSGKCLAEACGTGKTGAALRQVADKLCPSDIALATGNPLKAQFDLLMSKFTKKSPTTK